MHRRESLGPRWLRDPQCSRPFREEPLVPRYFFHVYDDIIAQDEEGEELPNFAAARLNALKGARELIAEQVRHGYIVLSHWIDVVDEQGDAVLTVTFKDAVDIKE
ncbi:DUF6894 family protein [Sphingomonas sp.]|uniref:DUF6894 family protein n=1 Tax=Sphingomonas sp. TaxID=28214 RepID=UPI0039C97F5A